MKTGIQQTFIRQRAQSFSLCSGSSGNAYYVSSGSTSVLIDAGLNCKKLTEALLAREVDPASLSAVFITHEHRDHVAALDVLARKYRLPVYMNEATWRAYAGSISQPERLDWRVFPSDSKLFVGDLKVNSFRTPHDAAESVGYKVETGRSVVSVFTDLGHLNQQLLDTVSGSDLVYVEANYDPTMLQNGSYPWPLKQRIAGPRGHLANENAAQAMLNLISRGTRQFVLAHLSRENNLPELAELTVIQSLYQAGMVRDRDYQLAIAPRYVPGKPVVWSR
ncbi:MAG: MBL fold metallo-hydrolase [Oscillospiraceae bacterium]|nr:MBL fold metallo-hydrolase [Oscillospiraceae bacterium]MDD4367662.1 MBL fold metallo-hydrolase [Oscillospiraceae bacterium]